MRTGGPQPRPRGSHLAPRFPGARPPRRGGGAGRRPWTV